VEFWRAVAALRRLWHSMQAKVLKTKIKISSFCYKDTAVLVANIESLVVKTIMAGEMPIVAASRALGLSHGSCCELYGYVSLFESFKLCSS
jgi:hypothetical protein